tara:strand:+ start:967 stop:1137 length:171 start_codon:yes stop_codon:yes gene_type:complete
MIGEAREAEQQRVFDVVVARTDRLNDWDLVDTAAPTITGPATSSRPSRSRDSFWTR